MQVCSRSSEHEKYVSGSVVARSLDAEAMIKLLLSTLLGLTLTLLSTFIGQRSAAATYREIMGCEDGCTVVATGWPLVFVRDYTGMSVINTADIVEVWLAADRFDWTPFLLNVIFWSGLGFATLSRLRMPKRH
jgi:hypothetical protein